jgi:tetratricopeptide (TPR) repeat protein
LTEERTELGKGGRWLFILIPLTVFYLYLVTLCPQIFWRDAAEFVATAQTLSISHPAGSPTYNLFAKSFTFLPFANVVFRVHMASAVCGALTIFLMLLVMRELFGILYQQDPTPIQKWGMALFALLFGSSLAFWKLSVTAEVYTLQDALLVLVLLLGLKYYRNGDSRLLLTGAFFSGLSLGAHMASGLFLPPLLLLILLRKQALKHLGPAAFFFVLGFSVYLYLPFRFEEAPLRLGYNTNDLKNTFYHITATGVADSTKKNIAMNFTLNELQPIRIWGFAKRLVGQVSYLGFIMGALGLLVLVTRRFCLAVIMIMMFVLYGGFFSRWPPMGLLPVYILWTIWAAVGTNEILRWAAYLKHAGASPRSKLISVSCAVVLLSAIGSQVFGNFKENLAEDDLSDFYIAHDLGGHILNSLDYGATLITRYSIPHFLLFYIQEVENFRTDVQPVSLASIGSEQALTTFISSRLNNKTPLFWVGNDKTNLFFKQLIPHGMVFRFLDQPIVLNEEALEKHIANRLLFEKRLSHDRYQDEYETYPELYKINSELHRYYWLRAQTSLEESELRALTQVNPTSPFLNLFFATCLFNTGKAEEARAALARSHQRMETLHGRQYSREKRFLFYHEGVTALNGGNFSLAEYFLREALPIDPMNEYIRYYLALALFKQGKLQEARKQCLVALELEPKEDSIQLFKRIEADISQRTPRISHEK